ncbi:cyclic nucleotide-binding domain-containing protein [Rubrobacter naiadicus]|uniref:cyclic nucleotide-binding domain-containing protein n=1 Tax=Rubrobacter naiadicus TaxID=1392641 RepID=UPI002360C243|nr:cyclic nucleotide-binding domain-containing protein [Rubrobacter naiadicus]
MQMEELSKMPLFESLGQEELEEFAEVSEKAVYGAGEVLIQEGRPHEHLFVILSGEVEVLKRVPGSRPRVLARMDAGRERAVVGEVGLLAESAATATVRARTKVEALKIPRARFRRMISGGNPAAYKLSYGIARTLARRLARLDEEVARTARDLEGGGDVDLEAFRDRLMTEWSAREGR